MSESDVVTEVPAAQAVPEQVKTAEPVADVAAQPETQTETPAPKTFTQEELEAAIGKRLSKERRKWEREQAAKPAQPAPQPSEALRVDQFESPEAYAEALAEQKAHQILTEREQRYREMELREAYAEREEAARDKYDDFEQVARNPNLPITVPMAEAILASEIGPEVAYHLGTNPDEAKRISRLSPFLQAKEIGRIEAKLAANPPVKKTSTAPAPIAPVTARGGGSSTYDTTDPRSVKAMSTSEWIAAERERQIKKWNAQVR